MSRGFKGLRPVVSNLDRAGELPGARFESNRGKKGRKYPNKLSDREKMRKRKLKGANRMVKTGDGLEGP